MLKKALIYGFAGWIVEVLFTGTFSAVKRDPSATAKTYLWMHPIYAVTALSLEYLSKRMRHVPLPIRAAVYTGVIYGAEYSSGWFLRRFLGKCPWDYSGCGRDVHGLVRLDYAPAWYALGLLFEPLQEGVNASTGEKPPSRARLQWPRLPKRKRSLARRMLAM